MVSQRSGIQWSWQDIAVFVALLLLFGGLASGYATLTSRVTRCETRDEAIMHKLQEIHEDIRELRKNP